MRKFLLLFLLFLPGLLKAQDTSKFRNIDSLISGLHPAGYVNDYVGILTQSEKDSLELKIKRFDSPKTAQIGIAIINTTGGYNIMAFGTKLANKWHFGYKGINNGLLVLVAMSDHKGAILTGNGFEKVVSNAACDQIIKTDLIPYFQKGQYYEGLAAITDDLMKCVKGEYKANQ